VTDTQGPRRVITVLGIALALLGTIGSVAVIVHAAAPPAEGNFLWLWLTMPAAFAGIGITVAAWMVRDQRATLVAAVWMVSLTALPYAWWVVRTVQQRRTDVGTLGGLILVLVGVPGVALLLWYLLRSD
jgi:hypothetical protein